MQSLPLRAYLKISHFEKSCKVRCHRAYIKVLLYPLLKEVWTLQVVHFDCYLSLPGYFQLSAVTCTCILKYTSTIDQFSIPSYTDLLAITSRAHCDAMKLNKSLISCRLKSIHPYCDKGKKGTVVQNTKQAPRWFDIYIVQYWIIE